MEKIEDEAINTAVMELEGNGHGVHDILVVGSTC